MKDYRKLIPLLLVLMGILACYSRVNESSKKEKEYHGYLQQAEEYRKGKIYLDSEEYYLKALEMRDTPELSLEIGRMLEESGDEDAMEGWGKTMIEKYPKNELGYTYLISVYRKQENLEKCFYYYRMAEKRKSCSEEVRQIISDIRYRFELNYSGYEEVSEYYEDYAVVKSNELYGYINYDGSTKIPPIYEMAGVMSSGVAPVKDRDGEFYFIDADNNRRINIPEEPGMEVTWLGSLSDEIYAYGNETQAGIADKKGTVLRTDLEDAGTWQEGAGPIKTGGKWYLADSTGKELTQGYDDMARNGKKAAVKNGVAFVEENGEWMLIRTDGNVVRKGLEGAECFTDDTYAAVKKDGKWGFMDREGKIVIEPAWEEAHSFSAGLAAVRKDGLWGYIDMEGRMAVEPQFGAVTGVTAKGAALVLDPESGKWRNLKFPGYDKGET